MEAFKRKHLALCIAITAVLLILLSSPKALAESGSVTAANGTVVDVPVPTGMEWLEDLLLAFEPLIGSTAVALIAAFVYAFIGKWSNHEAWDWEKFEPTLKVALINGLIFTVLQIMTGWSFAEISVWVSQIAGLYVMQKFWKAIGPFLTPLLSKLKPSG